MSMIGDTDPNSMFGPYGPLMMQSAMAPNGSQKRKQANAGILGQMLPEDGILGQMATGYSQGGMMGAASPLMSSGASAMAAPAAAAGAGAAGAGAGAGAAGAAGAGAGAAEGASALSGAGALLAEL